MRLFVAFTLEEQVVSKIVKIQENLKKAGFSGRMVNKNNLHVTLAFIGEVEAEKIELIKNAVDEVEIVPFSITLKRAKNFKNLVVIDIAKTTELTSLASRVTVNLAKVVNIDARDYYPHITIIRDAKEPLDYSLSITSKVSEISLYSTELIAGKIQYVKQFTKQAR